MKKSLYPRLNKSGVFCIFVFMLEVEGKTFHKFIEKKNYRVDLYHNFCNVDDVSRHDFGLYYIGKKQERYYSDTQLFSEEEFVKHFGNPCAGVFMDRYRFFVEESDDKISIKYQIYHKSRRVGNKFFVERKSTNYISFNFKTKLFYSGSFHTKKKQKRGSSMKVNPTYNAVQSFLYNVHLDKNVKPQGHFYFFLERIWDRMGIENPQNFEWDSPESFYSLTFYLVNGIKVPNNWRKFTHMFVSKKDLRLSNMNLVDTVMKQINMKGAKVKQILNEMEWVDFDRMYFTYNLLGIDRFNKIENKYFDEFFSNSYPMPMEDKKMGRYFECFYRQNNQWLQNRISVRLTPKEKDRILNIINYFDADKFRTLLDHLELKNDLNNLGEDVKFKFTNISSFNLEHEEFSRLLQSYRKGEVERYYGDVDSLETPIEYQGETYYPVLLRKTMDYEKESQHQRNCVRGYSERPDCLIFSIRRGSTDGDDRITVEYQYWKTEILNVQERARFNETPSLEFSQVAKIQLANINLLYKLGTLKLPKMVKKYRNGREFTQQATFDEMTQIHKYGDGPRIIPMTPNWDSYSPELQNWQNYLLEQDVVPVRYGDNLFDELP